MRRTLSPPFAAIECDVPSIISSMLVLPSSGSTMPRLKATLVDDLTKTGLPEVPTRPFQCVAVLWNVQLAPSSNGPSSREDFANGCMGLPSGPRAVDASDDVTARMLPDRTT